MPNMNVPECKLYHVDPMEIEDLPGSCCMSFGFDLGPLIQSIKEVGLINTPVLSQNGQGKLVIVTGYRRIQALKSLRYKKIPCRILPDSKFSPMDCLLLNLYDNLATRIFNDVEKAMALNRLAPLLPEIEILEKYMPLMDLPSHRATLIFYLSLEQEPDDEMKLHIARRNLSTQAVKMLLEMNRESRSCLLNLISTLNPNINQQKKLIDYINDISLKMDISVSGVLEDRSIKKILADDGNNNPQKIKSLLFVLRSKLFPTLVNAEKTFSKKVSALKLPKGVTINHPPFFEDPNYQFRIVFKEGRELKEKIGIMSGIEGLEEIGDPWQGRLDANAQDQ